MSNLRLLEINVVDSITIKARFTDNLDKSISKQNILLTSNEVSVPDPEVKKVTISGSVISVTCSPLTPYATYFIKFQSTPSIKFKSLNGDSFLFEDDVTNVSLIKGAEEPSNTIRDDLLTLLSNNIYNLDRGTLVRDIINSLSYNLSEALHDIGQVKNDNYIDVLIKDEVKERGIGPFDRLNEEGAFKIERVSKLPADETITSQIEFDSLPSDHISLQRVVVKNEKLTIGNGIDSFDRSILTVSNKNIIKLTAVTVHYSDGSRYVYDIDRFGYQIQNSKYDKDRASTLFTLTDNQFKLNLLAVEEDNFVLPSINDFINISYEYKDFGIHIDEDSVTLSKVIDVIRETVPPLQKVFSLKSPIVDDNDIVLVSNGVEFLDPNSDQPFKSKHPAFIREIPFKLERLPSSPGEYSIDYASGRVYVYGSKDNDGTGNFPPVATYKYRYTFSKDLDYVYNKDTAELVVIPSRDVVGSPGKISFSFEKVFVSGIDYIDHVHVENIDERVGNRIKTSNSLVTTKSPITNVFRVFNETTGEIYKVNRWFGNTVYFNSNSPPNIKEVLSEKISFKSIINELLIVNDVFSNSKNIDVLKINLNNNNIVSLTEDLIGSSYNSSAIFSRSDLFSKELFYDSYLDVSDNINRLDVGLYQVDYRNGIVYVGVDNDNDNYDIGFVSYKTAIIIPNNPHVFNVSLIYNSININNGINKYIKYIDHSDGEIIPLLSDTSDERFYNNDDLNPYIVDSGTISVTDTIKEVRHIYDAYDLNHNLDPVNFADTNITYNGNVISLSLSGIEKEYFCSFDSLHDSIDIPYISPGVDVIDIVSVIRVSDGIDFWNSDCVLSGYNIKLSNSHLPNDGDELKIIYKVAMNGGATPIVDYSRGDCYVDYTAISDEILISYEYGDNVLDFRQSNALSTGDTYYVTYRVGALRDALSKNFGNLIDIPEVSNFDLYLNREVYRDILKAALHSFAKGPTHPAIRNVVANIAKTQPEILESIFHGWSLGSSRLYNKSITTTGDLELFPGKFDNGVLINKQGQTITFPISSNLRLDEGTLEFWAIPEWNGLDNDATLTFYDLKKDGVKLDASNIYIGENNYHPTINDNGEFSIHKNDSFAPYGIPPAIHTEDHGLFIYYDIFDKRWIVIAKENIDDDLSIIKYSGKIKTSGEVYDVIFDSNNTITDDIIRSHDDEIYFEFCINKNDKIQLRNSEIEISSSDGMSFMSDNEHYFFDFGESESSSRFSIYKDGRGYLNFRVISKQEDDKVYSYKVSSDISNWKAGEPHHIAVSWILNSINKKDEMHLFIDGLEVPNIIKYGGRPSTSLTDRFRTVKSEVIIDNVDKDVIYGEDLFITSNSNIVTSESINFEDKNIAPGDTIKILEAIDNNLFTIISVDGNSLELDNDLPTTLSNVKFSINSLSVIVDNKIDLYSNIIISVFRGGNEIELAGTKSINPSYEFIKNEHGQTTIHFIKDILAGDEIVLRTVGLNHRRVRDRVYVWGNSSNLLRSNLPAPINLDEVKIIPILLPKYSIGPSNSIYDTDGFFKSNNIATTQPSNKTEGRKLNIFVSGGNVLFDDNVTIFIHGSDASGPITESIAFDKPGNKISSNKFTEIDHVNVFVKPIDNTKNSIYIEIKEAFSITESDGNISYPIIRYSYKTQTGKKLSCNNSSSGIVTDDSRYFSSSFIGQSLVIHSPISVAGTYKIIEKIDNSTVKLDPAPPEEFDNGKYDVLNIPVSRGGFQNGFFIFEKSDSINEPYNLPEGYYEFDYSSYLTIPFNPTNNMIGFIGTDVNSNNHANAIIDEFRILSTKLSDIRAKDSIIDNNDHSVTKSFNAIRPFKKDKNTLMLMHFNSIPFINDADYWVLFDRDLVKSSAGVNNNFGQSIVVKDKPLIINNQGILDNNYGTIEFWINPIFDTSNDPNIRYYFDASSAEVEEVLSISKNTIKVTKNIERVLSVKLISSDTHNAIDYFVGGSVHSDNKTIQLGTSLPNQKSYVVVSYIPSGTIGNRISIYKDDKGFINFRVNSNGKKYRIRRPIFWSRDTWHRVMVIYEFNKGNNKDVMRLFVDGEERGSLTLGSGVTLGEGFTLGQGSQLQQHLSSSIKFTDTINNIFIGSDYLGLNLSNARFNNIKISNIARPLLKIGDQPIDINYNSNVNCVYPVVEDLFTTYLSNFDNIASKNDDFAILNSKENLFDFIININDSFDIVLSDERVKKALEAILFALKPANSRVTINYKK